MEIVGRSLDVSKPAVCRFTPSFNMTNNGSQYVAGMTYTVLEENKTLAEYVELWVALGAVTIEEG